jgi:hypothetical protein
MMKGESEIVKAPGEAVGGFHLFGDWRDDTAVRLGSKWESKVRLILEGQGLLMEPRGRFVEAYRYVRGALEPGRSLPDFLVRSRCGKALAWIEVTGSEKERSIFLIKADKIKRWKGLYLPKYVVYYIDESQDLYWIGFDEIERCEARIVETRWLGEMVLQRAFRVPKSLWNKGLESLAKTLLQKQVEAKR